MRKLGSIGIAVVVIGLLVWNRLGQKDEARTEILKEMKEVVASLDADVADKTYLQGHLDRLHANAFENAYAMGGRHTRAKFDWNNYVSQVFGALSKQCEKDRRPELAGMVREVQGVLLQAIAADKAGK